MKDWKLNKNMQAIPEETPTLYAAQLISWAFQVCWIIFGFALFLVYDTWFNSDSKSAEIREQFFQTTKTLRP